MYAAWKGRVRALTALLTAGAKVDSKAEDGQTALMRAVREGHLDAARVLLEKGADPNIRDRGGWTPLLIASAAGHTPLALLLLDKGADPNLKSPDGRTALMLASLLPSNRDEHERRRMENNRALVKAAKRRPDLVPALAPGQRRAGRHPRRRRLDAAPARGCVGPRGHRHAALAARRRPERAHRRRPLRGDPGDDARPPGHRPAAVRLERSGPVSFARLRLAARSASLRLRPRSGRPSLGLALSIIQRDKTPDTVG